MIDEDEGYTYKSDQYWLRGIIEHFEYAASNYASVTVSSADLMELIRQYKIAIREKGTSEDLKATEKRAYNTAVEDAARLANGACVFYECGLTKFSEPIKHRDLIATKIRRLLIKK